MKSFLIYLSLFSWGILVSNAQPSLAGFGDGNIPPEVIENIFSKLSGNDLKTGALLDSECSGVAHDLNKARWKVKATKIDVIMRKFGDFIPLSQNEAWKESKVKDALDPAGITQELWVEVMGTNPSYFKAKKYCPNTYKEVEVNGVKIGMCPDLPMESVIAVDQGKKDSDVELMAELSRIYRNAGLNVEFRRPTREEYNWADTAGGAAPKTEYDPNLGKAIPYDKISNKDPDDLTKPSPSGKRQPRSILKNAPNAFGFRRSGVWEWVEDMDGSNRGLVGGSWYDNPELVVSGYQYANSPGLPSDDIGPSRLVRIQK